jgi:hypothetical protein
MPNDCATRCSWRQGRGRKRARGEQKRSKDCGKEFEKKHKDSVCFSAAIFLPGENITESCA